MLRTAHRFEVGEQNLWRVDRFLAMEQSTLFCNYSLEPVCGALKRLRYSKSIVPALSINYRQLTQSHRALISMLIVAMNHY